MTTYIHDRTHNRNRILVVDAFVWTMIYDVHDVYLTLVIQNLVLIIVSV